MCSSGGGGMNLRLFNVNEFIRADILQIYLLCFKRCLHMRIGSDYFDQWGLLLN